MSHSESTCVIEFLLDEPFSANDVLEKVLAGDSALNSRSILTGISKMMSTEYAGLAYTEEQGKGPRPVKVYHPG